MADNSGGRIRARRLDLGMTQAGLARSLDISASYLNLIEHGKRRISGKLMADTAVALGCEVAQLTSDGAAALADALRGIETGSRGGTESAERFARAFPGWAAALVAQGKRIADLERALAERAERMAHDPVLSAAVHEVLSAVTAIRSTSGILAGDPGIEAEWRARFHRNLYEDSQRLARSSRGLAAHLEAGGRAEGGPDIATPLEEVEAWFAARDWTPPPPEAGLSSFDGSAAGRDLLRGWLRRCAEDAAALPDATLAAAIAEHGANPFALADALTVAPSLVLRRMAFLPEAALGRPAGLVICDGTGRALLRRPVEGFALPRAQAGCALWPLYQALLRPFDPHHAVIAQAGRPSRSFGAWAAAEIAHPQGYGGPVTVEAAMLLLPSDLDEPAPVRGVGASCRICPRDNCAARRAPSVVSSAL